MCIGNIKKKIVSYRVPVTPIEVNGRVRLRLQSDIK